MHLGEIRIRRLKKPIAFVLILEKQIAMKSTILILIAIFAAESRCTSFIVANNVECTNIGKNLILRGATAPEVFIAVAVCEGVVHPMDSGLGGGFQAVVYNETCRSSYYLNSREKAPTRWPSCGNNQAELTKFIGVPSALKGYEYLYTSNRCSYKPRLHWPELFKPAMNLAYGGWKSSYTFSNILQRFQFGNLFGTNFGGTSITNHRLGDFIKQIMAEGPKSSLYEPNGHINRVVLNELGLVNEFMTKSDIVQYNVTVGATIKCKFMGYRVETTDLPGGGRLICLTLSILDEVFKGDVKKRIINTKIERFILMAEMQRYILTMHNHLKRYKYKTLLKQTKMIARKLVKRFKSRAKNWQLGEVHKYGAIKLPNINFVPNPFGTTNVVVKVDGVTIVATSTVNWSFGSQYFSEKYGFFYNNQLSDFNKFDPTHPNYCHANATPQSSISATYFLNKRNRTVFMVGAAGGKKILSSVFGVIYNYFIERMPLQKAVDHTRCLVNIRHNVIGCEADLDPAIKKVFKRYYPDSEIKIKHESGYSAITAATSLRGRNEAVFDKRRGGSGYAFE